MLDSYTAARFADAAQELLITALSQRAPHVLLRPAIFPDGNAWCALYGENLQEGIAGFGNTPELAAADFDRNWSMQKLSAASIPSPQGEKDGGGLDGDGVPGDQR